MHFAVARAVRAVGWSRDSVNADNAASPPGTLLEIWESGASRAKHVAKHAAAKVSKACGRYIWAHGAQDDLLCAIRSKLSNMSVAVGRSLGFTCHAAVIKGRSLVWQSSAIGRGSLP